MSKILLIKDHNEKMIDKLYKLKEFLDSGILRYRIEDLVFIFMEDSLQNYGIKYLKNLNFYLNVNYFKMTKRNFSFFSLKVRSLIKSGYIYCASIYYNYFFKYINFLKNNYNFLMEYGLSPIFFFLKGSFYSFDLFFDEIDYNINFIYNLLVNLFNFVYLFK